MAKGCLDIAESLYHRLLTLHANGVEVPRGLRADALHNLGMIAERHHYFDVAIDFYQQSVRLDKQRSMTWLFLSKIYLERFESYGNKQDYRAGVKALNKAAELRPDYPVIKVLKTKFDMLS